jgi:molybdopterin-guanine dinucleotide biosynthesis protein A
MFILLPPLPAANRPSPLFTGLQSDDSDLMVKKGRSAIVLAGGRSSRINTGKAGLPWLGSTLLGWTMAELERGFEELIVVAAADQELALPELSAGSVRVLRDVEPYAGPVKALRMGLEAAGGKAAFACACDLPFLNLGLALTLCAMLERHDAVIPLVEGRPQVLHAVYGKNCLSALDAMIGAGERKLQELARRIDVRAVSEDEMRRYDPDLLSFSNVNTPEDYARAVRIAAAKAPRARAR